MTDEKSDDTVEESSVEGQSVEGQSTSGQSTGGQSTGGQSTGAQSTGGQSAGGQSAGQTAGGQNAGQSAGQSGGTAQANDSMTGSATGGTGLEPNVAAAIAYLFAPLTGALMLLLEGDDDDYVRFHSIQSIGFGVAVIAAYVLVGMVFGVLSAIPVIGDIFALLAIPVNGFIGLGTFAVWALLLFKSYQGERYGLPVLGSLAASN